MSLAFKLMLKIAFIVKHAILKILHRILTGLLHRAERDLYMVECKNYLQSWN
jgi:hypothetical protein